MDTVVSLRFPAGRYHASPWGSHANEAEIEWPPSPWRILRALVACWHRKLSPARFPEDLLAVLIEKLAESDPLFRLPPVGRAHSRHYMPVRAGGGDRPVLIFDAFARIDPNEELIVAWPDVELDDPERELLAVLVDVLGYLGRAESWVEGRLLSSYEGEFNCASAATDYVLDPAGHLPVKRLAPVAAPAYVEWRAERVRELGLEAGRLTRAKQRVLATLPERLVDVLRLDTGDLRDAGWNTPPGGRMVTYRRPRLETTSNPQAMSSRRQWTPTTAARLVLSGNPLPRLEDTVRIGELTRLAAIHHAQRVVKDGDLPAELTGHGLRVDAVHDHAFYLPEDADGDGRIDHILVHAPGGLSPDAVAALERIQRLWQREGCEWRVAFAGRGADAAAVRSPHAGSSRVWTSVTPYLHPWHAKKRFGAAEQIARECRERGLPEPVRIEVLQSILVRDRERRPVHFHRFRSRRGLVQPDTHGRFLRLTFPEAVDGPLALGFGCHFGLGVFRAADRGPEGHARALVE